MITKLNKKLTSLLLAVLMILSTMMPVLNVWADDTTTYVFETESFADVSSGSKKDGDTDTGGTDNFYTINYSAKSKIDSSKKTFSDGTILAKRFDTQGATQVGTDGKIYPAVSFTTQASASVKIWWVCAGDGRQMAIFGSDGSVVAETSGTTSKNGLYISELSLNDAGTYYVGCSTGGTYIFKIEVTTKTIDKGPRADWSTVTAPVINSVTRNTSGQLEISVSGYVDHNGADSLTVNLLQGGKVISTYKTTSLKAEHTVFFSPAQSGDYTVEAFLSREGETDKAAQSYSTNYILALETPYITNCANLGDGKVDVVWNAVNEAQGYNVYVNGTLYRSTSERHITIEGLTAGTTATIAIEAKRDSEVTKKCSTSIKVGEKAIGWNYVVYGPSAKTANNTATENDDGSVTLWSGNNGGKLQTTGADGLGFYYTAVPANKNFTFRATIEVINWTLSNGQEGFGLMVTDHVPSADYFSGNFWTNSYQALASKIEYKYEDTDDGYLVYPTSSTEGTKYTMKLGIGTVSKIGLDQSIIDRTNLGEEGLIVGQNGALKSLMQTLEALAGQHGKESGSYNLIGNYRGSAPEGTFADEYLVTELTLEIQKNNTGYFVSYYNTKGELVGKVKNYDEHALESFDSEYVYVGMFTSRNARVKFKDVSLTTIDKADDAPAEERPIEKIYPLVTVTSTNDTTSMDYELIADTNLDGTIDVLVNNRPVLTGVSVKKYERLSQIIDLREYAKYGENDLVVKFTPDPDQELEEYTELATTNPHVYSTTLNIYKGNYHRKNIYVSPDGMYYGTGSKEDPYDIYTAIKSVVPGQTIILMEGTYNLTSTIKIQRGVNGTEEAPIRMIADPEANTRPVLDFGGNCAGILHGGNWWYFYGFDVTNSQDAQKGFQVSGSHNVLDQIHTYHNGNTGIQISRYNGVDLTKDQWPSYNLILNCTSYGNADRGYEDADGFAAKLTIGDGNVFDGCLAYNNADDGWDLYAKTATGSIGSVVIKNCIAYGNGYLEDGTNAGNGNGFKMGGDSLSGQHQLINSIAFNNKAKGIDSNSCPDIIVRNSISYNNGSYNVAFYTNTATNTNFIASGIISFKDSNCKGDLKAENFKTTGNQDKNNYVGKSNFYWTGSSSANSAGETITADMFVTLDFKPEMITRNADGSLNTNGFLQLKATAPTGSGTTGEFTPSDVIELVKDLEHNYSDAWTNTDKYVHWHECECGDKYDIGGHTFEYIVDQEPTETSSGYKHNECTVCGYKQPRIEIPALGSNDTTVNDGAPVITDVASFFAWLWYVIKSFFMSIFA